MELVWNGKEPFTLQSGEQRTFLEDGDLVTLKGFSGNGTKRIGFGECSGKVVSALDSKYFEN